MIGTILFIGLSSVYMIYYVRQQGQPTVQKKPEEKTVSTAVLKYEDHEYFKEGDPNFLSTIQLDLPLEKQDAKPSPLENGCEITALSMLLNYYGYDVNKNSLAKKLDYVPFKTGEDTYGNPQKGFVGNIYGGDEAMGVFVQPIAKVAKEIVGDEFEVVAGTELSFGEVLNTVQNNIPVWVLVTVDFQVPEAEDFIEWNTEEGEIKVTPLIHAAVITGMDATYVYLNDPHGEKDRPVKIGDLEKIYNRMGKQSLYVNVR